VRCTPAAAGARAASLTVDTDADNVPQDPLVPLTCNGTKPDITAAPASLTFVGGSPGTPEQLELTVSNASGSTASLLSVSSLAISGTHAAEYTVSPPGPFTLAPGANRVLTVTFTPAGFGARTASLTIASDDQETPSTVVPLTGSGSAPEISVTPVGATIAFGSVNVGATGAATNVVITNTGNENLDITGVLVTGAQSSQFLVTGPATPATVVASDDETWTVACKPTSGGAKAATLEIHSTDADEATISYALTCTGTVALLARTSPVGTPVTFTSTRMGESSSQVTVIFENTGNGPLTITGAVASPAEFMITTPFAQALPFVVAPGGVATLGVQFTPSATGDLDGMLDINWDATSLSVPLKGPGRIALASITPIANLDGDVDLGAVCVGQARVVPVRIQNIGTAPFDVISAVTTGDAFSVETVSLTALSPGASLTMDLTVDAELGDETGTLEITTDIPTTPVQTLSLLANGIESGLGVAPSAIAFPGTLPGDVSERQPVTITNCEADPMAIGQVALQGSDAGDFGIVGGTIPPPALTLDPSESAQWLVEFHPDTEGGSDATMHISHDLSVGGGVIDIPLYGFGGLGSPDAGPGPDPDAMLDPDAEPAGPDAEDPGVDQQSYYACSTGTPSTGTLLLFLGAIALVLRRRRPPPIG
jgi:MYXO-CTERM domain-containing protein